MINYSFSLTEIEYFLLILVRVSTFVYLAPFYGMKGVPNQVKIGISFFVSVLLFHVTGPHEALAYNTVWGYGMIVAKEALTGLFLGFGVSICTGILAFAGRIIDMETGLSMVNLVDPTTKEMSSMTGVLYQYMVTLILLVSGMHRYLLQALAETYILIPVNGAIFHTDKLLETMLLFLRDYILIGFRICLPVFAVMLLLNAVLGIMAKVSPQMNMFAVGLQLKVLVGLCVLFITVRMLPGIADFIYTEMKQMMVAFVQSMR
jgi:flagellar biosynthetic protein FliR